MPTPTLDEQIRKIVVNLFHLDMRELTQEDVDDTVKYNTDKILSLIRSLVPEELETFTGCDKTSYMQRPPIYVAGYSACRQSLLDKLEGRK